MTLVSDPVESGIVTSLARPGGNVTGLSLMHPELGGKRSALLKEISPEISRVAVLWSSSTPAYRVVLSETEAAARSLGMHLQPVELGGPRGRRQRILSHRRRAQRPPDRGRRSTMKMHLALVVAAVFAISPLDGVAGEKQVVDVKELAGSWRGWVTAEMGDERATMNVQTDGSYEASTTRGSTSEGQFYLQDGKLRYRSSRTTGTASLSEDKGKTTLTVMPEDATYGKAEYERVK